MRSLVLAGILAIGAIYSGEAAAISADAAISEYNEAIQTGDDAAKIATAQILAEAAMANPDRSDATILGLEAAKTLCLYGDCKSARPVADWVSSRANGETGIVKAESVLIKAYADWKEAPSRSTRKSLDEALAPMVEGDLSSLTLAAFQNRYVADANAKRWGDAQASADAARRHYEPFKSVVGQQWSDAAMISIISGFNMTQEPEDAMAMARHHVALSDLYDRYEGPAPEWLKDHFYRTYAWQEAMASYFQSGGGERQWSNLAEVDEQTLRANLAAIMRDANSLARVSASGEGYVARKFPLCQGEFNKKPAIRYGGLNALRGQFGSVILKLSIKDGKVDVVEPLASVPLDVFKQRAVDAVSKWKWIPAKNTRPGIDCSLNHPHFIYTIRFYLD